MKTLYYKLPSLKAYAFTLILFITLTLSTNSVFSQSFSNDTMGFESSSFLGNVTNDFMFSIPDDWHEEFSYWGAGVTEYRWRISPGDLFSDWGIWAHDMWYPMGTYGIMEQTEVKAVGAPWVYATLVVKEKNGYGTLDPGRRMVSIKVEETQIDPLGPYYNTFEHTKGHIYIVN